MLISGLTLSGAPHRPSTARWTGKRCDDRDVSVSCTSALARSRELAAARVVDADLVDPFAAHLAGNVALTAARQEQHRRRGVEDIIGTRYLDDTILNAVAYTNNTRGDYNQVVLLGDAMDTRPFRLLWPAGTFVYSIAPADAHAEAAAILKEHGAKMQQGCLMRRIEVDPATASEQELSDALSDSGFRGDKLSVWCIQGLAADAQEERARLTELMAAVTNNAAFNSLVIGHLDLGWAVGAARSMLAEFGLLGVVHGVGADSELNYDRWDPTWALPENDDQQQPLLVTAQHLRLSLWEMGVYDAHVTAGEEVEEDFGNFS